MTKAHRDFERTQALERSEYYGTLLDTETENNFKLQEKETDIARQTETLHHHYGRLLDKQKKEYDTAFDSARALTQNRINQVKQDSELALRMAHKDYTAKTSIIVKEFEKKLADQKESYEIKLDDMKTQTASDIRAAELKNKIDLEIQAKNYEAKIAQIQAQNKERERTISQNYQDELDRTRRSYELVIQKKS